MEKIQWKNNEPPAISAENLNQMQDNVENAINGVVESGSNSNGNWIRYVDGTQICYKIVDFGDVPIKNPWGVLYESNELIIGDYAKPFIEEPAISIMPINTFFVEKYSYVTNTSWGKFWATRPNQYEALKVKVHCIAIGKWK